jgi:hypothetical protein
VHEIRLREAVRKARTEAEEEAKEKQRVAERRHLEEGDAVRAELALLKRRLEEAQREADNSKRKITLSKQDGKMEAQAEVMGGGVMLFCVLCTGLVRLYWVCVRARPFYIFFTMVSFCALHFRRMHYV